jgi:dTDP-4-dehydrorhamnose reductase
MRILITGACGMLGVDLVNELAEQHELLLVDIKPLPSGISKSMQFIKIDITDGSGFFKKATSINPDIVIHTAAYTDVDGSESNADTAFRVNAIGTRNVALACQRFDTVMLYISTDYVFNGEKKEPYTELDSPDPRSVYGKSKYWGELYVQQLLNKFYIVRTSGVFGKNGKNFVSTIIDSARKGKGLRVVNDQFTAPTYTSDLAGAIKKLINTDQYGIWHVTNGGSCSWCEFAEEIIKNINIKTSIEAISTEAINRPAKRPEYSVLDNYLWRLQGFTPLRNWKNSLKEFIEKESL